MLAFVGGSSSLTGRGRTGGSIVAAIGAALARARTRRRFLATRNALLELDDRTLQDVTGLSRAQVWAMRGDRADRAELGLL